MNAERLILDGESLTLDAIERIALDDSARVELDGGAVERMARSREVVEDVLRRGEVVYGVTTGFGRLADIAVEPDRLRELQLNLIRSHACGIGDPLPRDEVRAMTLLRANVLAKGFSGIRHEVVRLLVDLVNHGVHPVIPEQGSVGASGDLAPLSHLALVLVGEGKAEHEGTVLDGADALRAAGLRPVVLEAKEGLALNNGTQAMVAVGGLAAVRAERLIDAADLIGAMTLEGLRGTPEAFHPAVQRARPHPGHGVSADRLRAFVAGSEIRESHRHDDPRVQDAYALRCMPQVHGAARDGLAYVRRVLEIEANSATDNPLVFPDETDDEGRPGRVVSAGNFHGQPVAQVLDVLCIALADIASVSERRTERLVNPDLSDLPAFLTRHPGIHSGFMIAQVAAAALANECKHLASPTSVDTIPTGANKEDHVSMGMTAALRARRCIRNAEAVLAIELLCAAQALEFLRPMRSGDPIERAHRLLRRRVEPLEEDRVLSDDIARATELMREGAVAGIARDA